MPLDKLDWLPHRFGTSTRFRHVDQDVPQQAFDALRQTRIVTGLVLFSVRSDDMAMLRRREETASGSTGVQRLLFLSDETLYDETAH
jgi:hypothetical protein